MTTSGTTSFTLTAQEVIVFALRKINILSGNSAHIPAEDAERARVELNLMMKGMQRFPSLWRLTRGSQSLTAATASYTLSTTVPYRIAGCRYRNAAGTDIPMINLTGQEYDDLPLKTSAGIPTQFYFDAQRDAGVLYVWPVLATVTTETIQYTYQRRFQDVTDLAETLDCPPEALEVLGYNLAARLADDYGQKGPNIDRIIARAEQLRAELGDSERPDVIRFMPEARYG